MTYRLITAALLLLVSPLLALDGEPGMHDPSTVIVENGRFYSYGTGGGMPMLVSDDGWTWSRAGSVAEGVVGGLPSDAVLTRGGRNTWAPDVIHVGDQFFMYYSAPAHPAPRGHWSAGRQDA